MIPLPFFNVASQLVVKHGGAINKLECSLNPSATEGLFLLLFDSSVAVEDGVVPIKAWPAAECGYKTFEIEELGFGQGLYVALSTTAATLTQAAGGNDKMAILNIELYGPDLPSGTTIAGDEDQSNPVTSLLAWAFVAGPKKLMQIVANDIGNNLAADRYLQIWPINSPSEGAANPVFQAVVKKGQRNEYNFGVDGIDPTQTRANIVCTACNIVISETSGSLTEDSDGCALKAEYK